MDGDQYENLTLEEMQAFVRRHEWTFAKTMPQIPHEYLLEWNADNPDEYFRFMMTVRRLGYDDYFFKTKNRYADVDGYKYWTMGEYLNTSWVLNRAKLDRSEKPLAPNPVPFVPKLTTGPPHPRGSRVKSPTIPCQDAERIAAEVETLLRDSCERIAVTGDVRQKIPSVREILFLVIPKLSASVNLFDEKLKMLQTSGQFRKATEPDEFFFENCGVPVKFLAVREQAWFPMLFKTSSCRDWDITVATAAKGLGLKWVPARCGFENLETNRPLPVNSEEDIFRVVKLPVTPPARRAILPVFEKGESGRPLPMTREEVRAFVAKCSWVDTRCGGELHQYTFRTGFDELEFLRVAEFVRQYGYDGMYLGKLWRYLDLDGLFYFTYGAGLRTTTILNRKPMTEPERPWVKNPKVWVDNFKDPAV